MEFVLFHDQLSTLDLYSKKNLSFNLIKAQKIFKNMKSILSNLAENKRLNNEKITLNDINKQSDISETANKIKTKFDEKISNFVSYYSFETDMLALKNLIYHTNGEIKMDTLLSRIDFLNALKNHYGSFKTNLTNNAYKTKSIKELNEKDITFLLEEDKKKDGYASLRSTNVQSIDLSYYTAEQLTNLCNSISKEINELENKRDMLNATTIVNITLTQSTIKLLGL